jgi:hypothetical protein
MNFYCSEKYDKTNRMVYVTVITWPPGFISESRGAELDEGEPGPGAAQVILAECVGLTGPRPPVRDRFDCAQDRSKIMISCLHQELFFFMSSNHNTVWHIDTLRSAQGLGFFILIIQDFYTFFSWVTVENMHGTSFIREIVIARVND